MEDFEIPEEELKRIRKEAEERHRAEQEHKRELAQPNLNETEPHEPQHEAASACPKCGFSFNGNGIRCGHCKYQVAGQSTAPSRLPERRGFFPRLDPSTPVGEVFRSPFGILLIMCWVPNVLLLVVILTGIWPGPSKVEHPAATKSWPSDEDNRAALAAYERYQARGKAFVGVRDSALAAAICSPLALGVGLYVVLTEKKTNGYNHISALIKVGWGLIAIAGAINIVGAPVFVGYSIWRYSTL